MPKALMLEISPEIGSVEMLAMRPRQAEFAFVFAHGAGAGMTHPFMTRVAEGMSDRRIASLRYQFPYMQAGKRRVDSAPVAHATVRAAVAKAASLWPDLPLFAGGKSFGGRMTSQAQSIAPLPEVVGLIFLAFPLHPSRKPSAERAAHLATIDVPLLFIRGARDALAEQAHFDSMVAGLGSLGSRLDIPDADHGFHVPRRSGKTDEEVLEEVLDGLAVWTQAWRVRPTGKTNGANG